MANVTMTTGEAVQGFGVTLYARTNMAAPVLDSVFTTIEEARARVDDQIAKSGVPSELWKRGELHGYEYAECKTHGFQISEAEYL